MSRLRGCRQLEFEEIPSNSWHYLGVFSGGKTSDSELFLVILAMGGVEQGYEQSRVITKQGNLHEPQMAS